MLPKPKVLRLPKVNSSTTTISQLNACGSYGSCRDNTYNCTPYGNECIDSTYDSCSYFEVGTIGISAVVGAGIGIFIT